MSESATEPSQPAVTVELDAAGRIVVASEDTAALDRIEQLMERLAPPPEKYRVFRVVNRKPENIVDQLELYFREFLAEEDDNNFGFFFFGMSNDEEEKPVRLSQRRPLRFLADDWSSTILVANASANQLREIERLIDAWDRQPIDDRILMRRTTTVKLQYAKATTIVEAVKEVYRELLSRGDKEFDTAEQKARGSSTRYLTQIDSGVGLTEPTFIGFDGLLSLGADDDANVIIVSAQEEVFDSVMATIRELDQQARPTSTVRVVPLGGVVAAEELRETLQRALAGSGSSSSSGERRRDRDRDRNRSRRRR